MSGSAPTAFALPFVFAGLTVLAVGTAILLRERFSRRRLAALPPVQHHRRLAAHHRAGVPQHRPRCRHTSGPGLTTLFVLAIPALQYHFASVITGQWRRHRRGIAGAWLASMLLLVVHLAGQMHAGIVAYSWGYYPLYAPAGWVFVVLHPGRGRRCASQMYWQPVPRESARAASHPGAACCCCRACPWPRSARSTSCRRWASGIFPVRRAGGHGGQHRQRLYHLALSAGRDHAGLRRRPADGLHERRGGVDRPRRHRAAGEPCRLRDPGHRPRAAVEPPAAQPARAGSARLAAPAVLPLRGRRPRRARVRGGRTAAAARWTSA